jgi:hypothetical protein
MFAKILMWLLKLVDLSVTLDGDILTIVIELGSIKVLDLTIDLIKDKNVTTKVRSVKTRKAK